MLTTEQIVKIIDHYGKKTQLLKAVEEMGELTQALCKYEVTCGYDERNQIMQSVVEEIADVDIMLEQLKLIFGEYQVNLMKRKKIERLMRRIENE